MDLYVFSKRGSRNDRLINSNAKVSIKEAAIAADCKDEPEIQAAFYEKFLKSHQVRI